MNSQRRALALGLFAVPFAARAARSAHAETELYIASDGDALAFVPDRLSCASGALVRLHFRHRGAIIDDPHDWVLLRPGTEAAFLADADRQPEGQPAIPPRDAHQVIAATRLCAKGHAVSVQFIAPAPGDYPFVCAVPGHGATMHGVLSVTPRSLENSLNGRSQHP